jgi:hypothetical protein
VSEDVGYSKDKCHFNFPGCKKFNAGYQRAEDAKPRGPFFDACEVCVTKPYPRPAQFENSSQEKTNEN